MSVDQLKRLRDALMPYELNLLESEWQGWHAQYRFRCIEGHELSRSASYMFHKMVACPACRDEEALRRLDQVAREAGGRCLSEQYAGRKALYRFVCREGHVFEKTAHNLMKGTWCVPCARARHAKQVSAPDGMKRIHAAARARGGTCLSTNYTKMIGRYLFQCEQGHEWETTGSEVVRGVWCGKCADAQKSVAYRRADGLEAMQAHAAERGGICLATEYVNNDAYYPFRCEQGHEWETKAARIFRGSWCPKCQNKGNVYDISDLRRIAKERGGRCLSRKYTNARAKLEFECAKGHRWSATAAAVVAGNWCRTCVYDSRKLGIDLMHAMAKERGGRCISTSYVNSTAKLEWECHIGHRWFAPPNSIRNGHWCRLCAYLAMTTDPETIRKRRHLPDKY